ncbi:MAG: TatD family hydrolase [Bacteroidota bacterium]
MFYIDTHAHLFLEQFDNDREQVVKNAIKQGVGKIILPNVDLSTMEPMLELSKKFPKVCYPAAGIHPTSVKENYLEKIEKIKQWIKKEEFIAIGEIGLDLYWDKNYLEQQKKGFKLQLEMAKENQLPVIIHTRESFDETINILSESADPSLMGVFHSFTGNLIQAKQIMEYGFMIGINGIVTFKNAGLDKVVKEIDLDYLLLETDSPYLAPVPKRGKRNESSYLISIAEKIASLKNITMDELAEITTRNARKLFFRSGKYGNEHF